MNTNSQRVTSEYSQTHEVKEQWPRDIGGGNIVELKYAFCTCPCPARPKIIPELTFPRRFGQWS